MEIRGLVRRGFLHPIHEGVYAVGHKRLTTRGHLIAATLAGGPGAFFSDRTAAAIRGLGDLDLGRIEMTLPIEHTRPRRRTGIIFHRTTNTIDPLEVTHVNGLPCSTIPRILIEVSRRAPAAEIEELIAESVRTGQFQPDALEAAIRRHEHRPGVGKLKNIADYYRPLPDRKSELERMFDREHAKRPEIPPCERNIKIDVWEIDCHWPEQKVALELDGRRYHTAEQDFDKDRRKDTALQLLHLKPMRASYWMWRRDKEAVIRDLLALLALRA
jgi:very-short-patch-repair endonuclease